MSGCGLPTQLFLFYSLACVSKLSSYRCPLAFDESRKNISVVHGLSRKWERKPIGVIFCPVKGQPFGWLRSKSSVNPPPQFSEGLTLRSMLSKTYDREKKNTRSGRAGKEHSGEDISNGAGLKWFGWILRWFDCSIRCRFQFCIQYLVSIKFQFSRHKERPSLGLSCQQGVSRELSHLVFGASQPEHFLCS